MNLGISLSPPSFGSNPELVTVVLWPDRIDVVVRRHGTVVAARRIPITVGDDPNSWPKDVYKEADRLRELVVELGVERAPAVVVYTSPTQAVDLVSLPMDSPSQARQAAILGCMEAIPYPFDAAVAEAVVIGRDDTENDAQTHVVVAVDRQDVTGMMVEMTEAAGLDFQSATPIAATIIAWLASQALRNLGTDRGSLYVGGYGSFLAVGGHGILKFGRVIPIGLETLAESLTRPIRSSEADGPIELDISDARRVLYCQGIADADEIIEGHAPLRASQLAPLLQPVLQRFVVELRQSLRFCAPETPGDSMTLAVTGPASAVPGFASLLGRELSLPVSLDSRYAKYQYDSPASAGCEGNLAVANRRYLTQLNLQPPEVTQQRSVTRIRRWLWTGVAAALVIVGLDALWLQVRQSNLHEQEIALGRETAELEKLHKTQARLATAVGALETLHGTIVKEVGAHVDFRAVLHELSRLTPQSIEFSSLHFSRAGDQVNGSVSGYAELGQVVTGQTELNAFIEALKQSPLIDNVELLNVHVASIGQTTGERFESVFKVIAIPSILALESTDAVAEGPR